MNKKLLREILNQEVFDSHSYDLEGGLLPERYTLSEEAGIWAVYYSERGLLRLRLSKLLRYGRAAEFLPKPS